MTVEVSARIPDGVRPIAFAEEMIDWFAQYGGQPDVVGKHFPPGVRPAEHDNEVVAQLYKIMGVMLLEFDDPDLAVLFKLRFGGK